MELKKRVLEDNVTNITRSGKHYKPSFLEKDNLGRDLGEGSKTIKPKGKEDKSPMNAWVLRFRWYLLTMGPP